MYVTGGWLTDGFLVAAGSPEVFLSQFISPYMELTPAGRLGARRSFLVAAAESAQEGLIKRAQELDPDVLTFLSERELSLLWRHKAEVLNLREPWLSICVPERHRYCA